MKKATTLSLTIITLGLLNTISASALTFQNNANVEFTLNPTINITLSSNDLIIDDLAPGSASDSNIITATVSTNAGWGYYLSATANTSGGNTNLTHETSSTDVFTSLSSNAPDLPSMPDNTWGYSYCNNTTDCSNSTNWISGDTGSAIAGYNGLPLDGNDSGATGVKLLSTNSFSTSTSSIKFKIGAKAANTQAAGTYNGTVNFYAVTTPSPTTFDDAFVAAGKEKLLGYYKMQDMTTSICQRVEQGFNTKLIDVRDNEIYTIAKLKDDNCWMLDNLRLGGNQPITLTNQDTNMVAESWTLPISGFYYSYTTAVVSADDVNYLVTNYGPGSGKMGAHYNYCATSAGTFCSSTDTDIPTTSYDICPINWRLPTGDLSGEYGNLYAAYNNNANNFKQAISATLSGFNGFSYVNTYGEFWSSTYYERSGYTGYMYRLSVSADEVAVVNAYQRHLALSIRCIAK